MLSKLQCRKVICSVQSDTTPFTVPYLQYAQQQLNQNIIWLNVQNLYACCRLLAPPADDGQP